MHRIISRERMSAHFFILCTVTKLAQICAYNHLGDTINTGL